MKEIIRSIANLVNDTHDIIMELSLTLGLNLTDKQLHLWVMGIIGIFIFFNVQILFKLLAKWSITLISFIYTFTVIVVIVFTIEIQQKITGRGNMEFADAVIGIYGFLIFFFLYLLGKALGYFSKKLIRNKRGVPLNDRNSKEVN
ncbi:hypothetical protein [Bacillus pinisoli]|uniref:hypothetical protein n=1 Tax=Bacillus pinisoli TaxID=2901866 RepID=UPI001FF6F985|nr:hypothetical protein [Bacillus pinisoli]